jgi:hypothetical protein
MEKEGQVTRSATGPSFSGSSWWARAGGQNELNRPSHLSP